MSDWLGIRELGDVCATARARNLALFELLGGWVTSTPDGELQRLYAEACHRHAAHAALWAARAPAIAGFPGGGEASAAGGPGTDVGPATERNRRYVTELRELRDEVAAVRSRVDATLDPSTARTLQLVDTDLAELQARADATSA